MNKNDSEEERIHVVSFPLEDSDYSVNDLFCILLDQLTGQQFLLLFQMMKTSIDLASKANTCFNCGRKDCKNERRKRNIEGVCYNCEAWEDN